MYRMNLSFFKMTVQYQKGGKTNLVWCSIFNRRQQKLMKKKRRLFFDTVCAVNGRIVVSGEAEIYIVLDRKGQGKRIKTFSQTKH